MGFRRPGPAGSSAAAALPEGSRRPGPAESSAASRSASGPGLERKPPLNPCLGLGGGEMLLVGSLIATRASREWVGGVESFGCARFCLNGATSAVRLSDPSGISVSALLAVPLRQHCLPIGSIACDDGAHMPVCLLSLLN